MELSLLRTELPLHLVHIRFDARSSEGSDVSRVHGKTLCLSLSLSLSRLPCKRAHGRTS